MIRMKRAMNLLRTVQTIRFLKPIQIIYQLIYRLTPVSSLKLSRFIQQNSVKLTFSHPPLLTGSITLDPNSNHTATYLNLSETFTEGIDWSSHRYGKLWNYHLQYAGFLNQTDLTTSEKTNLLLDLYRHLTNGDLQPEPYPASLRIMNAIRFLCTEKVKETSRLALERSIFADLQYLSKRVEYHLLGNHLLENAFALLMGGTFFHEATWTGRVESLLETELEEQILNDGAHFERSPMYHNIILFRVLEAVDYLDTSSKMKSYLKQTAAKMLGWVIRMKFSDGATPHFNDSVSGVAPDTDKLLQRATELDIQPDSSNPLSDSGYRKIETGPFELFMDLEGIEPSYQPGHAHADSLSVQLHVDGKPFLTDPGVSTYEVGERRDWERSTEAHNTLSASGRNSADVWAGFRVGKRPSVKIVTDQLTTLSATLEFGSDWLTRTVAASEDKIIINDHVVSTTNEGITFFHFAPDIRIVKIDRNQCILNNGAKILVSDSATIENKRYLYAEGFNLLKEAEKIEIRYHEKCVTTIYGN